MSGLAGQAINATSHDLRHTQGTVNTMPPETLLGFAHHGKTPDALPRDGADAIPNLRKVLDAIANFATRPSRRSFLP
jgi:hypothetical protein